MFRRSLASTLLAFGLLAASVVVSCLWVQHTVLAPQRTVAVAETVLADDHVQDLLAERLVGMVLLRVPAGVPVDEAAVRSAARAAVEDEAVRSELAAALVASHRRALGEGSDPVVVSGPVLTGALAGALDPLSPAAAGAVRSSGASLEVPVPTVPGAGSLRPGLAWVVAALTPVALGLLAGAFVLHPRRPVVLSRVGWWFLGVSLVPAALLWALPTLLLPTLESPWALLAARVLVEVGRDVVPVLVLLALAGTACIGLAQAWRTAGSLVRSKRPGA